MVSSEYQSRRNTPAEILASNGTFLIIPLLIAYATPDSSFDLVSVVAILGWIAIFHNTGLACNVPRLLWNDHVIFFFFFCLPIAHSFILLDSKNQFADPEGQLPWSFFS